MDYLIISVVAFVVSGVTLFSGFGLGTVLMPTFALFFAVPVAVAATAVVHLANNCFKLVLVGRQADWPVSADSVFPPRSPPWQGRASCPCSPACRRSPPITSAGDNSRSRPSRQ